MNLIKFLYLNIFLLIFININYTQIIESPNIEILNNYLNRDNFFIFDIDNTLIEPKSYKSKLGSIGSDQWFCASVERKVGLGITRKQAVDNLLPIYTKVQNIVEVKAVEQNTSEIIKKIQEQKINAIALTFRSPELSQAINRQLSSVDINLSLNAPSNKDFELMHNNLKICYLDGVMYCNGNDKGEVLKIFFEKINYFPKKIVCLDDKLKCLLSIEKIAKELGIEFLGIRYSNLDNKVNNYKLDQAEIVEAFLD